MELLHAFGIDYKILIAQFLNFAVLFFVLYKVGYNPIFKFLEERRGKIQRGITMAAEAEAKLRAAQEERNAIVSAAKKEAGALIAKAHELAEQRKEEKINQAKEEIAAIINREKEKLSAERARTLKEIKTEVADLIALALEKIMGEKMSDEKNKEIIREAILRR